VITEAYFLLFRWKKWASNFVQIFTKCWRIFKILSLAYSVENLYY